MPPQAATGLPPTVVPNRRFCAAAVTVLSAGVDNSTGFALASVSVAAFNIGDVAVPTPWTLTIQNDHYAGLSQVII